MRHHQPTWEQARAPEWRFELLDNLDQPLGELRGTGKGRGTVSYYARLGGDAEIEITRQEDQQIDYLNNRIRVSYDPGMLDLERQEEAAQALSDAREALRLADISLTAQMTIIREALNGYGNGEFHYQEDAPPAIMGDVWIVPENGFGDVLVKGVFSEGGGWDTVSGLDGEPYVNALLGVRAANLVIPDALAEVEAAKTAMVDPIPWGVYLFTSPVTSKNVLVRDRLGLLPKMVVIDTDSFEYSYSAPAGTNCINEAVQIIQSCNEYRISATPSDATLTNPLVFEAGESKLTVINKLLGSAGYGSLWCDATGLFRVEPYVERGDRPVMWTFRSDNTSIIKPGTTYERDIASVPNRVVVVSPGDDENPAIVGIASNNDPDSPYSIPNRQGRVITRREEVSDISSQEEADALARRYLIGGMSPVAHISAKHAIVPLEPGDRVNFVDGDYLLDAIISKMTVTFGDFGSQCSAEWSEV